MITGTYTPIHVHSEDSLLDSCTRFSEYIDLMKNLGMNTIATTEHGLHRGYISKKLLCDDAGIKLLIGVEVYLTEQLEPKVRDNYHTVLIARNQQGLEELHRMIRLSTEDDHFYYDNRLSFDEFLSLSENIITTSACLASPLNRLPDDNPYYMKLVSRYDYLEVQPHRHPDQVAFNKRLLELSKRTGKPLIAGTDTHSATKYKAECRQILNEAKGKTYPDDEFDLTFKSYDELVEMFRVQGALPEEVYMQAVANTNVLADSCEEIVLDKSIKYPILYGSREEDSRKFLETIDRKFKEKLESGVIPAEQEQAFRAAIDEEIRVFQKLHMDGFMLSMSELISWCKEHDIAIGTARGSVGGSRVAYVTDIIDLNPEQWHTVFSRFANEDREEIGDIDIDCIESDRPKIFEYIISRFGEDKTARVASYGTIKEKGVIDDVGRALARRWEKAHETQDDRAQRARERKDPMMQSGPGWSPGKPAFSKNNPYSLAVCARIKDEFDHDPEATKKKYPELFYYFDGLIGTKVSQSVHPAGMVISPISLSTNFGTFKKNGEWCLLLDMEEVHDGCGLAKYDFLILKTVQVIRDTCRMLHMPYPKTYQIDWNDEAVWADMRKNQTSIFQFESGFAADCFKKFKTDSIEDMSLVTACIRPSGTSYRDQLLKREVHHNPSAIIDELLKDNLGWLVYQEDTIKFLQQICGLSGSQADNIRRAIGRKQKDRLDKAMPDILEGYCSKSDKPREQAEEEAKEFLQVIEDSASYQFGYNHSIAYCLLGYLCGYFRYYHPGEYITAYLNNAANDDDIASGTMLARLYGFRITMPKFGISGSTYSLDNPSRTIAKGLSSVKGIGDKDADELLAVAKELHDTHRFTDLLALVKSRTRVNSAKLSTLLHIDFFDMFGNQRELEIISDIYDRFADAKKIRREEVEGSKYAEFIRLYSTDVTKAGKPAAMYTITDTPALLHACEDYVRSLQLPDYSLIAKAKYFASVMGYSGYTTGREEDMKKLYVKEIHPLKRKADGKQFGYSVITQSIGSGKEARFTVFNREFNYLPITQGDIIRLIDWSRDKGMYFTLKNYTILHEGDMSEVRELA